MNFEAATAVENATVQLKFARDMLEEITSHFTGNEKHQFLPSIAPRLLSLLYVTGNLIDEGMEALDKAVEVTA